MAEKILYKKILIVDDDEPTRELYLFALKKEGYEVIEACNGSEGISKAKSEIPDLIILDIVMPDMDGITVLSNLRQNDITNNIPIICASSKEKLLNYFQSNSQLKITAILPKPFKISALVQKVKEII